MSNFLQVSVPDIGDFKDVPVIEILVKSGESVTKDDSLIVLESDKATMEIPTPSSGVIKEISVKVGDKVSQGDLILLLESIDEVNNNSTLSSQELNPFPPSPLSASTPSKGVLSADLHTEVLVLGGGPGGYTAAFRSADLGKKTILVERYPTLGGVCLNVGCIPSKALLHVAKVISEAEELEKAGVQFNKPVINVSKLLAWKQNVVGKLTKGLSALAKQRKVDVIHGMGKFVSPNMIRVETSSGFKTISFDNAIIATGSQSAKISGFSYDDPRIMDSTAALEIPEIPNRMLVIGGGIIGLEMATVYDALGSKITVVELMDQLIPGADPDLVRPLMKRISKRYEALHLKTKVSRIESLKEGVRVFFEGDVPLEPQIYDRILVAVGRRPNGSTIDAENAGVSVNNRGYIPVDRQLRTNVSHIFGIGDVVGEPMLAHKATHEGKLAAEIIAGHKGSFDARTIPSVAYTDPEIAWMGLTETHAKAQGIEYEKAVFPWAASGRAISTGRDEGMTKLLFDKSSRRIVGAGMVGPNAGELIAETVLALEMGADYQDIALTIHPHPTLSETIFFAAEIAEGSITDLYMPKK